MPFPLRVALVHLLSSRCHRPPFFVPDSRLALVTPRLSQVDDDPFACMIVQSLFETKGWLVTTCNTSDECFEKLEAEAFAAEPFAAVCCSPMPRPPLRLKPRDAKPS